MKTTVIYDTTSGDGLLVQSLYEELLEHWEAGHAIAFAGLFADNGNAIGFDGSQMNGKEEIQTTLTKVFEDHEVASYISIVEEVRQLSESVYLLRAVVGMIPPGKKKIKPERNAIQTLVAEKSGDRFVIAAFHNTPAAFDGRPQLRKQLTKRLKAVIA